MIRQLLSDGYYPKSGNTSPLVDFEEYEVAQNHKEFWSLKAQPTTYALLDGEVGVGTINERSVSVPGGKFELILSRPFMPKIGKVFQYLALRRSGELVPFFLTTQLPLQEEEWKLNGLSFFTTFDSPQLSTKNHCFFVAIESRKILGQFLADSRHPTKNPGAKGTIHVRADLEPDKKAELLAVLFAVSTLYARHLLDTTGF